MSKILILLTVSMLLFASQSMSDEAAITNAELAELVASVVGITLPLDPQELSDKEYYEAISNALAVGGIDYFVGKDETSKIKASDLADLVYLIIGGKEKLDSHGKIKVLIDEGYMTPIDPGSYVSLSYAVVVLNHPSFSVLLAEAYQDPSGERKKGAGATGVIPEEAVSPI